MKYTIKAFNIFHHALSMLLYYLGKKFRFAANLVKNENKMHYVLIFTCTHFIAYRLLTYYFVSY